MFALFLQPLKKKKSAISGTSENRVMWFDPESWVSGQIKFLRKNKILLKRMCYSVFILNRDCLPYLILSVSLNFINF